MELIPAIDLRGGRCVRLFQGDFAAETVYSDDPAEILERYCSFGTRYVHVVDLDGARDGSQGNRDLVVALAATRKAKLQVGGGLRSLERAQALLDAGIDRVVIGSVAVTHPAEVKQWLAKLGGARVVLGFDVRLDADGTPQLTTHGWQRTTSTSLWRAVDDYLPHGLKHVLCTGALTGPNFALYRDAVQRFPEIAWQASGGIASSDDLQQLRECGVKAAISGKALLENRISVQELRPFLPNASSPVSM
jgi:phosphoribosylformimino-5-aminoimidazole carboxamide ribotide isomerase